MGKKDNQIKEIVSELFSLCEVLDISNEDLSEILNINMDIFDLWKQGLVSNIELRAIVFVLDLLWGIYENTIVEKVRVKFGVPLVYVGVDSNNPENYSSIIPNQAFWDVGEQTPTEEKVVQYTIPKTTGGYL